MSKYKFTDLLDFASTKMGKMATVFMAVLLVFSLSGIALAVDEAVDALAGDPAAGESANGDEATGAAQEGEEEIVVVSGETAAQEESGNAAPSDEAPASANTEEAIQEAITQDDPAGTGEEDPAVEVGTVVISVTGTNCTVNVGGQDFTQGEANVPLHKDLTVSVYPTTGYELDYVMASSSAPIPTSFDLNESNVYVVPAELVDGNLTIIAYASPIEEGGPEVTPATPITEDTELQEGNTTPNPIYGAPRIVLEDASKEYDAFPISSTFYDVEGLEDGDELFVTSFAGSQTEVGRSTITVDDYMILRDGELDVTNLYEAATVVPATISVTKATLYIVTPSASKAYDGTPLAYEGDGSSDDDVTMLETLWNYDGPEFTLHATGSQTEVGSSVNTYELRNVNPDDEDIYAYLSARYNFVERLGTLTVTPVTDEVYVIAPSDSKFYDGTALEAGEVLWGNLPDGFTLEARATGSITDVGRVATKVDPSSVRIFDANGDDATSNFPIEFIDGQLQVSPAILYVLTFSETKVIDGRPLTAGGDIAGLVAGETVTFRVTGVQEGIGSSRNSYTLTWDGTAKRSNYQIVEDLGTLRITEVPDPEQPYPAPSPGNGSGGNGASTGGNATAGIGTGAGTFAGGTAGGFAPANGGAADAADSQPAVDPTVEAVATGLQNIEQVVRGDEPTDLIAPVVLEEAIDDDGNPLGVFDEPVDCWVHWYSLIGLLATAVYGGVVMFFRRAYAYELETREASVLGTRPGTAAPQVPAGSSGHAGREA